MSTLAMTDNVSTFEFDLQADLFYPSGQ